MTQEDSDRAERDRVLQEKRIMTII